MTLCIHLIQADESMLYAMVTLCTRCKSLADDRKLRGDSIPDFLRHLWRHLHHAEKAMQVEMTASDR